MASDSGIKPLNSVSGNYFSLADLWQLCLQERFAFEESSSFRFLHPLLFCLEGRLGLGTQDSHNSPQQVCVPVEFEAQKVLCGVDCSMIVSTQHNILACGSNRYIEYYTHTVYTHTDTHLFILFTYFILNKYTKDIYLYVDI